MCLNNILKFTLAKEKNAIIMHLFNTSSIVLFYYLLDKGNETIYPIILASTFLVIYLVHSFFINRSLYVSLNEAKNSPGYKYRGATLFTDIFSTINEIHYIYINKLNNQKEKYDGRDSILSEWIHNMKTSVAVIKLAAESGLNQYKKEILKDILVENNKLQDNLECALNLFRLEQFSNDYVPQRIKLKSLVTSSINKMKTLFIYNNIFPNVNIDENFYIYTDKKWSSYVIEQIIANAIKYSSNNKKIQFYSSNNNDFVNLHIKDYGLGIKSDELGRVFDAFFTGTNGRREDKSSGIGLYMCKTICNKLNTEINIESEENLGTTVTLSYLSRL